jgi:hypothetical protein
MEAQKFVLRLVDAAGELLAWSTVYATPAPQDRGASCPFWPVEGRTTRLTIGRTGRVAEITVHWCELDVARRAEFEDTDVEVDQVVDFHWLQPVWLVAGMRDVPLPPVTVTAAVITVAPGAITGRS